MDVDGYLRRFIDLDYRLPNPPRADFCASLSERFNLLDLFRNRQRGAEELAEFLNAFSSLSEIFKLSLRSIELCFAQLNIVFRTTPSNKVLFANLVAFLIALRARNLPLYDALTKGTSDLDAGLSYIKGLPGGTEYVDSYDGIEIEALHAIRRGTRMDSTVGEAPYRNALDRHSNDSPEWKRADDILKAMTMLYRQNAYDALPLCIRRIELAEHFNIL